MSVANNRLMIVDSATGDWVLLAKGFGAGWQLWDASLLAAFLEAHDLSGSADLDGRTTFRLVSEDGNEPGGEPWRPRAPHIPGGSPEPTPESPEEREPHIPREG
jgi:hypothetical protein